MRKERWNGCCRMNNERVEKTMRREHVMTKCSLAEKQTSCANPFSGVWGQIGLHCSAFKEIVGYVQLPLWCSVPPALPHSPH